MPQYGRGALEVSPSADGYCDGKHHGLNAFHPPQKVMRLSYVSVIRNLFFLLVVAPRFHLVVG